MSLSYHMSKRYDSGMIGFRFLKKPFSNETVSPKKRLLARWQINPVLEVSFQKFIIV
jgi:hypothetical protein